MRLYTFTNYYLSSIQKGIQSAHVVHELFTKYRNRLSESFDADKYGILLEWAEEHKTMVVLNGGNSADLEDLYLVFEALNLNYPFVKFHEDEQSLNGALTCVGIVLDERMIDLIQMIRERQLETLPAGTFTNDEIAIATAISRCGLAN